MKKNKVKEEVPKKVLMLFDLDSIETVPKVKEKRKIKGERVFVCHYTDPSGRYTEGGKFLAKYDKGLKDAKVQFKKHFIASTLRVLILNNLVIFAA